MVNSVPVRVASLQNLTIAVAKLYAHVVRLTSQLVGIPVCHA